jgi:PAS domain S-box-containing protein
MTLRRALSVLELHPNADLGQARAAYHQLAKQRHPDTGAAKSVEGFIELVQAFDYLKAHLSVNRTQPRPDRASRWPTRAAKRPLRRAGTSARFLYQVAQRCQRVTQRFAAWAREFRALACQRVIRRGVVGPAVWIQDIAGGARHPNVKADPEQPGDTVRGECSNLAAEPSDVPRGRGILCFLLPGPEARPAFDEPATSPDQFIAKTVGAEPRHIVVVQLEISQREPAEQPSPGNQQKRQSLFEQNPDGVMLPDADARIAMTSPAWTVISGCSTDELIGQRPVETWILDPVATMLGDSHPNTAQPRQTLTTTIIRNDAATVELPVATNPLMLDGIPPAIHCATRVITDARGAEDGVHHSQEQLVEMIPDPVWVAGPDGCTEYCNGRFLAYTGKTLEEMQSWTWSSVLHPEDAPHALAAWTQALNSGRDFEAEVRLRHGGDGSYRWHLARAYPLRDDAGRIIRWFGTCTDIEDQKQVQIALRHAREVAEEARIAKDRFLAALSQQLRAPLTPALRAIRSLERDQALSSKQRELLSTARRRIELEARLIDDLLDLTKLGRFIRDADPSPVAAQSTEDRLP